MDRLRCVVRISEAHKILKGKNKNDITDLL